MAARLLSSLGLLAAAAAQQLDPDYLGPASNCPLGDLHTRITELNEACCLSSSAESSECAGTCDADCVAVLFPLLDQCRNVINNIYDGADGTFDGEASGLTGVYDECLTLPDSDVIDMLKAMQDRGQCPATALDGVAETELKAPGACTDVWSGGRCELSIASGVFTCGHDFCDTVPTRDNPCVVAGQCDRACNFCGADAGGGNHRRRALAALRRQLQMAHVTCNPATFAAEAAAVETACCDDAQDCQSGTPTSCDAKCAVVFNGFYDSCQVSPPSCGETSTLPLWRPQLEMSGS